MKCIDLPEDTVQLVTGFCYNELSGFVMEFLIIIIVTCLRKIKEFVSVIWNILLYFRRVRSCMSECGAHIFALFLGKGISGWQQRSMHLDSASISAPGVWKTVNCL